MSSFEGEACSSASTRSPDGDIAERTSDLSLGGSATTNDDSIPTVLKSPTGHFRTLPLPLPQCVIRPRPLYPQPSSLPAQLFISSTHAQHYRSASRNEEHVFTDNGELSTPARRIASSRNRLRSTTAFTRSSGLIFQDMTDEKRRRPRAKNFSLVRRRPPPLASTNIVGANDTHVHHSELASGSVLTTKMAPLSLDRTTLPHVIKSEEPPISFSDDNDHHDISIGGTQVPSSRVATIRQDQAQELRDLFPALGEQCFSSRIPRLTMRSSGKVDQSLPFF